MAFASRLGRTRIHRVARLVRPRTRRLASRLMAAVTARSLGAICTAAPHGPPGRLVSVASLDRVRRSDRTLFGACHEVGPFPTVAAKRRREERRDEQTTRITKRSYGRELDRTRRMRQQRQQRRYRRHWRAPGGWSHRSRRWRRWRCGSESGQRWCGRDLVGGSWWRRWCRWCRSQGGRCDQPVHGYRCGCWQRWIERRERLGRSQW
jgi:hypothetical protein